jgi:L-lactate dehydrogenase complex protein LldG
MSQNLTGLFKERYEAVAGIVHVVGDDAAAVDVIAGILKTKQPTRIALAAVPEAVGEGVAKACAEAGIDVLQPPFDSATFLQSLDGVDIGITGTPHAIAETGTLIELSTDDATRLVSSLPRTHIAVLPAGGIVERFREGAAAVREAFEAQPGGCAVSMISGPSRTGDIEMILTLGVHGPEEAHVVVITGGSSHD